MTAPKKKLVAPGLPRKRPNRTYRAAEAESGTASKEVPPASRGLDAPSSRDLELARRARFELARRSTEALGLYRPLPKADTFHRSPAKIRLCIGSNQAGKSLAADWDLACLLRGCHPYRKDVPKENALFYYVGFKQEHISSLMWPRLRHEGAFEIIRDEHTHEWRIFNPTNEYDAAYKEKRRPAAPLLPERFIKAESYKSKKDNLIRRVEMVNGNKIIFFSSKEKPQQGTQIHGWRIDEDVENNLWPKELFARALKNNAPGVWSATPECGSQHLYHLYKLATRPFCDPEKYFQTQMLIDENPFISPESKKQFFDSLNDEERRIKYFGEFAVKGQLVYGEFARAAHCIRAFPIPAEWARFMVVDPGVSPLAVLFFAICPDPLEIHFYDEVYVKSGSATKFAEEVAAKMGGYRKSFRAFLIDNQMGRQADVGYGRTVREQYSEALAAKDIVSQLTGSDFIEGSTDRRGREEALRGWLQNSPGSGHPYLRVHLEKCPMFVWEMESQLYKKTEGVVDHTRRQKKENHLVDCAEYAAAFDPEYAPPPPPINRQHQWMQRVLASIKPKQRQPEYVSLGPPSSPNF